MSHPRLIKILLFALPVLTLSACAQEATLRKREEDPNRVRKASEKIPGYEGKPLVERHSPGNTAEDPALALLPKRHLVYVTETGKRGGPRHPITQVYTEQNLGDFARDKKRPRMPKGQAHFMPRASMDKLLAKLQELGFASLPSKSYPLSVPIGTERALHLIIGGQRISVVKDSLSKEDLADSPRAVFTKIETFLITGGR